MLLQILGTCGLAAAFAALFRGRREIFRTTLGTAWVWQVLAVLLWSTSWGTTILTSATTPGLADRLWYLSAVMMLCPLVAVLGARKPGNQAWNWFVIAPLVLVLNFPSFSLHGFGALSSTFEIEAPVAIGYGLVLVMGAGNYFGTRFTLSTVLLTVALILCVGPVTAPLAELFPSKLTCRLWATLSLSAAFLNAARQASCGISTETPFDQVWIDFRDFLGIVWSKRMLDRINHTAREEQWPVRLELYGFIPTDEKADLPLSPKTSKQIERTLRRYLKRFVEPDWIDRRLNSTELPDAPAETP